MTDYSELRIDITPCDETATDLMAAYLAEIGYESFVPDEKGLTAYIKKQDFSQNALDDVLIAFPMNAKLKTEVKIIEGRDWNEEWEKHYFQPIVIGGECVVFSSFHSDVPDAKYKITIDPRMAFGTGHHATTSLIIRTLLEMDLSDKSVIDMGTGTGILAILCDMLGAEHTIGIEIDPYAADNARDNVSLNKSKVEILTGNASQLAELMPADIFIANINRNVILADMQEYIAKLKQGGFMILSGFYKQDIPLIKTAAEGLELVKTVSEGEWSTILLSKN